MQPNRRATIRSLPPMSELAGEESRWLLGIRKQSSPTLFDVLLLARTKAGARNADTVRPRLAPMGRCKQCFRTADTDSASLPEFETTESWKCGNSVLQSRPPL